MVVLAKLLLMGLAAGCTALLTACADTEGENGGNPDWGPEPQPELQREPQPKDEIEDALKSKEEQGEPVVKGAEVLCFNGKDDKDILQLIGNGNSAVSMVGIEEMTKTDTVLSNQGKFQFCKFLNDVCPGAEIEDNIWQCSETKVENGPDENVLNKNNSFMFCLKGFGIIYLLGTGQNVGALEDEKLLEVFDSWWNGKFMLRKDIEPIVLLLDQKNKLDGYPILISKNQFLAMGFDSNQASVYSMIDMNRVLNKYDITTTERLRHFFAQCYVESGSISGLPIEDDYGDTTYFDDKVYFPYIGVGHIQMTSEAMYLAFAIYVGLGKYPQFAENVNPLTPANNGTESIRAEYDKLKEEAEKAGINIEEITNIVEPASNATQYVAENYEWETAGYFWRVGEINDVVEKLIPGDKNGVDNVTEIVNKMAKQSSYNDRKKAYEDIIKVIQ